MEIFFRPKKKKDAARLCVFTRSSDGCVGLWAETIWATVSCRLLMMRRLGTYQF